MSTELKSKLKKESKAVKGAKEKIMCRETMNALLVFAEQSEEFERAIMEQEDKNFADCMKAVAEGVSGGISDCEAYKKAVRYYFPTAEIAFEMKIYMSEYELEDKKRAEAIVDIKAEKNSELQSTAEETKKQKPRCLTVSLEDLF